MGVPDYQTLMLPVLRAASDGEVAISEVISRLGDQFNLSLEERSEKLKSGQRVIANRAYWAKVYLSKAGLVENTRRGHYMITDRGRETLRANPDRIDNNYLSQFEEFREFRSRPRTPSREDEPEPKPSHEEEEETPDEVLRSTHARIEKALAKEILVRVLAEPFDFFEKLVVSLLLAMGYGGSKEEAGRSIGRSGDEGIDGVIDEDVLGLDQIYIQAKRYKPDHSIDAPTIREFIGSLEGVSAAKGVFVTTSSFTAPAKEFAEKVAHRVILIVLSEPIGDWKKAWETALRRAGLKLRWHDLRHAFVTRLAENPKISEETILALAGHVSKAMLRRYAHVRNPAKQDAIDSLEVETGRGSGGSHKWSHEPEDDGEETERVAATPRFH